MFFEAIFTGSIIYLIMLVKNDLIKRQKEDAIEGDLSAMDIMIEPIDPSKLISEDDLASSDVIREQPPNYGAMAPSDVGAGPGFANYDDNYVDTMEANNVGRYRYEVYKKLRKDALKSSWPMPPSWFDGIYVETSGGYANKYAEVRNLNV